MEQIEKVSLQLRRRKKVGLGITEFGGAVIVSRVEPGSISSEVLQQGDKLAEIEGKQPGSKKEASQMIVNALIRNKRVSLKISRANNEISQELLPLENDINERKKSGGERASRWSVLLGVPLFILFVVVVVRWILHCNDITHLLH
uniref:PDZ domain-containing protein n=1 Tax=Parascaris univalens TaxID=6257 RepID=A0A915B0V8_PARUN